MHAPAISRLRAPSLLRPYREYRSLIQLAAIDFAATSMRATTGRRGALGVD